MLVEGNLAVIALGFALLNTGIFNIIMTSTPIRYSGISLGMSVVIMIIGMSIGPIVSGFFMQSFQTTTTTTTTTIMMTSHPSAIAYNMIFFTGILISVCSVILSLILRKKMKQSNTNSLQQT